MKKNPSPLTHNFFRKDSTNRKIVLITGGGSGGHLFTLMSVCRELRKQGARMIYMGREHPLEREVIGDAVEKFYGIPVGKLRRNLSIQAWLLNLLDIFHLVYGMMRSLVLIRNLKNRHPDLVIFSSGGFVAVAPVLSGFLNRIPIVIHEQTARAGLANRFCGLLADRVCLSFRESEIFFKPSQIIYTGFPLREEFYKSQTSKRGDVGKILRSRKPVVLFSGGSNGSLLINNWIGGHLTELLKKYCVVHQTGKKWLESCSRYSHAHYFPLGFISQQEWPTLLKRAEVLVGRSGAATVHECVYLNKKAIFIPLAIAQKNEQYHNADYASRIIDATIIKEENLKEIDLPGLIAEKLKIKTGRQGKSMREPEKQGLTPAQRIASIILAIKKNQNKISRDL